MPKQDNIMNNDNSKSNKKKIMLTLVWFAIALLIILIAININPISAFISTLMEIIAPVLVGGAIAYLLNPILKFLEFILLKVFKRKKITRIVSAILTYIYAILVITLLFAVVAPRLVSSITDIGRNYSLYIESAINVISNTVDDATKNFDGFDSQPLREALTELFDESEDIIKTVTSHLLSYGKSLIVTLKNIFIGLFISIYILMSKERLYAQATKGARAFLSDKVYNNCLRYLRITNATFGRFFIGKLFDSTIIFAVTVALLAVLKIPYPVLIAMIVSIINIIPFFGLIVGIVISAFIVLIAAPDKILIYVLLMIVVQQLDANVIAPKILGSSAGISSLGVIIAVTVMGSYFGIPGMILGVPFFAIIISIAKDWLEKRLAARDLPTHTQDYYSDPDYSSDSEDHKPVSRMLCEPVLYAISRRVNNAISSKLKKEEDLREQEEEELYEDDDPTETNGDEKPQ